ncbi:uncharacterized protein LOC113295131 [Papaver somniferum]|uniref:uncharacterized protein LOC113295131 n=1 Tax=Papaver somniferum TaxID=3469 RepID=UPI000E6F74BA|nr:uncharacterized protein LOC113295131 [Papaver somniferum]
MNILKNQWKLTGDCLLIPLGKGFFTIKLSNEVDKNYINNSTWDVEDQVLKTRNWIPNFRPENQRTSHALIWVSLPVKVDDDTIKYANGYAAKVLVEIDPAKPVPNKLWIITKCGSFSQGIILNKPLKFCTKCKIVGHLLTECRFNKHPHIDHPSGEHGRNAGGPKENSSVGSVEKVNVPPKMSQKPFDIAPSGQGSSHKNGSKSSNEAFTTNGSFKSLQENEVLVNSGEETLPQEGLTPTRILQVVEDNSVEKSVIKFINGKDGTVSSEKVHVTSWSRVVQKPSNVNATSTSTESVKVITQASSSTESVKAINQTSSGTQIPIWVAEPKVVCNSSFCNKLNLPGIKSMVHNSVANKKGNIWLVWNKNLPTPSVVSMSSQIITVEIGSFLVSGIHAHVGEVQRIFFWSEMEMISGLNLPWLAIGDFNVITSVDEKIGGKTPNKRAMLDFNNCLDTCELLQAPRTGIQYSWSNCQQGSKRILYNLDRAVFNQLWLQKFHDWEYKVGLRIASDHAPLLGGCTSIPKPQNAPMRFQKMWISHPTYMEVVQQCWSEEVMEVSDNNPFDENALGNLVEAQNLFHSKEVQLNTFLKQKSRIKWVKEGATNNGFLHTNIKIKQARNNISELEDENGEIISDQKKISEVLVKHFENKFKCQEVENVEHMVNAIPEVINSEDQDMLEAMPDENEIKSTLFDMDPDSAPGPGGFSGCFYRACWHIIHKEVVEAIQFCWKRKFIPIGLNSNFLVLIPKTEGVRNPNQFRPIGLSNVSFKIFTKIIATRMGKLMHRLVSPQQVAYVKDRCIQDQIMLAYEMVNEMEKKRRCGNVGLKLDISQAYDSVSWDFLFKVLIKGLRQFDPLSPILFVLMEEALSRRLTQMVNEGLISSMVERKGIHPTHLLFTDDVFIFCNRSKKSILNLMKLLEDYQKCSGQIINKQKSKMFIDGTSEVRKNQLKELIQMERSEFPDKYLGVILCVGRVKISTV